MYGNNVYIHKTYSYLRLERVREDNRQNRGRDSAPQHTVYIRDA